MYAHNKMKNKYLSKVQLAQTIVDTKHSHDISEVWVDMR